MAAFMSIHQQCVSQQATLQQHVCAVEGGGGGVGGGGVGGCDGGFSGGSSNFGGWGGEGFGEFGIGDTHLFQSACFPGELDDLLQTDQTDFCLESVVSDAAFSESDFQDLLEINFDLKEYKADKTEQQIVFKKGNIQSENTDLIHSIFPSQFLQHDDVCESYEATKAHAHLENHPPSSYHLEMNPPSSHLTNHHLDDFLGDLDNFDFSKPFLDSIGSVGLPDDSFFHQSLSQSFEAPIVSTQSLSASTSSSSLSSLLSSFSPQLSSSLSSPIIPLSSSSSSSHLPSSSSSSLSAQQPLSSSFPSLITLIPFQTSFILQPSSSLQLSSSPPSSLQLSPPPSSSSPPSSLQLSSPPSSSPSSSSSSSSSFVQRPEKRQRKKEQNKTAALKYRHKKRVEQGDFMHECDLTQKRNNELKTKVSEITKEIQYLKNLMREISSALT